MKKLLFLMFLSVTTVCKAGEIVIDNSTWTQEEQSQMFNAIAGLIGNQGYTFEEDWCQGVNNKVIINEDKLKPAGFDIKTLKADEILTEARRIIAANIVLDSEINQEKQNVRTEVKTKLNLTDIEADNLIQFIKNELGIQ